jgi:hypothetical protein
MSLEDAKGSDLISWKCTQLIQIKIKFVHLI